MNAEPILSQPPLQAATRLLTEADLAAADLTEAHMTHFFYCGPASAPIGLVGLEFCGAHALLRSLVVAPDRRGTGLGAALVSHAEAHAREQGARSVFLLTTTAESFFSHRGYARTARDSAPAEIKATREFADICPASSAFMFKRF